MEIKLYSMKGCTNCELAKTHLNKEEVVFSEIDCEENIEEAVNVMKEAGSDFLPIICYNKNKYIKGYDVENINKLISLYKN